MNAPSAARSGGRTRGPVLLNSRGARMDRHAATRRLHQLAEAAGIQVTRAHPHMLRHTFVTTSFDADIDLRDALKCRIADISHSYIYAFFGILIRSSIDLTVHSAT